MKATLSLFRTFMEAIASTISCFHHSSLTKFTFRPGNCVIPGNKQIQRQVTAAGAVGNNEREKGALNPKERLSIRPIIKSMQMPISAIVAKYPKLFAHDLSMKGSSVLV